MVKSSLVGWIVIIPLICQRWSIKKKKEMRDDRDDKDDERDEEHF